METRRTLAETLTAQQHTILKDWVDFQLAAVTLRRDLMKESELREQSREFLSLFGTALMSGSDLGSPAWKPVKEFLAGP